MQYLAKTFHGLEPLLAEELEALGATDIELLKRAVRFTGDQPLLYKANLHLRTAIRILQPIFRFEATDEDQLYWAVYDFNWFPYLKINQTFAIDATVYSDTFRHSKYVALKSKDAIVDQFRKRINRRPNVDTQQPDIRINIHVFETSFTVSLDTTGDSLHKRGYRMRAHAAPLNEVLAAGMVLLSGWKPDQIFIDPMCGSGTLLMEAALLAKNIPPAPKNRRFAFQNWKDYDPELWKKTLNESKENIKSPDLKIIGSDYDQYSLDIAKESILKFRLEHDIQIFRKDFKHLAPPEEPGIMVTNPPYGERIDDGDMENFYEQIGDRLKQEWQGWEAWIISSNMDALKKIGLKASKKQTLYNGPLECKFQQYSLYAGSKKEKKAAE